MKLERIEYMKDYIWEDLYSCKNLNCTANGSTGDRDPFYMNDSEVFNNYLEETRNRIATRELNLLPEMAEIF